LYIFFRGKFYGISWKNDFSKLFPQKIPFFPNIFGEKFSAEFSPKFSPEKMYKKSAPADSLNGSSFMDRRESHGAAGPSGRLGF
jgi:hypothetical protein